MGSDAEIKPAQNTIISGLSHGIKRVDPKKIVDDLRDGDYRYLAGYVVAYMLKIVAIVVAAYYGVGL